MGRQKPLAIVVMQRIRTSHFAAATLALLVMLFVLGFASPALSMPGPGAVPAESMAGSGAVPTTPPAPIQITRDELQQAKLDVAIAQAKAEVVGANNSTMGVIVTAITGFGAVFTTILLGSFAFATYRQSAIAAASAAAAAAKTEIHGVRAEFDILLATAQSAVESIQSNQQVAAALTANLQAHVNSTPTADPEPLPADEEAELAAAVAAAKATPPAQRTAQQFRQLMLAAKQAGDWPAYREQAGAMAYLFADAPDDLAFAMFGRAFASGQLDDHIAAAAGYADYLAKCPDDIPARRAAAFYNWGSALSAQARASTGAAADALWALAVEKYAEAVRIKPDMHEAFTNWGIALSKQAQASTGAAADALWALAIEKYAEAVRIKPDKHEAFTNWGNALSAQAKTKSGAEADQLFAQAGEKYAAAEAILPGLATYNLACLAALSSDAEQAAELLRIAKTANVNCPDCAHIAADSDFDAVRNHPAFQAVLADIGCGPATA